MLPVKWIVEVGEDGEQKIWVDGGEVNSESLQDGKHDVNTQTNIILTNNFSKLKFKQYQGYKAPSDRLTLWTG